jgi:(p)ppGpp synthase/HD superfamily hydrolase
MVAAAWLHDVIEDCGVTAEDLAEHFATGVVRLVVELTNPSKKHPDLPRAERKRMDREHAALVSREAKVIKLADRVDNLQETADDPRTPCDFVKLYRRESADLLEVLRGADKGLEQELEALV